MFSLVRQFMKVLLALSLLLFLGCASNQPKDADVNALRAAESWFSALDSSDGEYLWEHTSQFTQNKEDKAVLLKHWLGGRKGFGKVIDRDLQLNFEVDPYRFKGNIPDGVYRQIIYWTKYENRDLTKEEVLLSLENNEWKILQYVVK